MGVLDKFEKGVERVVSNAFAKAFKSEVKPVELASALRRELDDRAAVVGRDRTVVPNSFTIELSPADLEQVLDWGAEPLADLRLRDNRAVGLQQQFQKLAGLRPDRNLDAILPKPSVRAVFKARKPPDKTTHHPLRGAQ